MADLGTLARRLLGRNSRYLLEGWYLLRYLALFSGGSYHCPCCGARPRRFLPAQAGPHGEMREIRCPRCDAHPRHRLLWLYLPKAHPELFAQPLRLLHIAPEFCFYRHFLRMPTLAYVTADIASPLADCRLDLMCLPFAERVFDVIFCNHVLEHVVDDEVAMRELFRVLKPGGWALLQVPVDRARQVTYEDNTIRTPAERARHFGQHDHLRLYGTDYAQKLGRLGFVVSVSAAIDFCDAETIRRCVLDPDEMVYLASRPPVAL